MASTTGIQQKNSRFDMRLTAEQRNEIERAAAIKGKSLTQWSLDNLLESARRDIEEEATTLLSKQAFEDFMRILDAGMPSEACRLTAGKPVWEQ